MRFKISNFIYDEKKHFKIFNSIYIYDQKVKFYSDNMDVFVFVEKSWSIIIGYDYYFYYYAGASRGADCLIPIYYAMHLV